MKLSEAIRLGGMLKPQGRGPMGFISPDKPCALGGALQAIGRQPDDIQTAIHTLFLEWPWTQHYTMCPCGESHRVCSTDQTMTVLSVIWALNDVHGWTRSQIADWVETFEPERKGPYHVVHKAVRLDH